MVNVGLLSILRCPLCLGEVQLKAFQENGRPAIIAVNSAASKDVVVGLLKCGCGSSFPIIDGVPRLLEGGLDAFPEFREQYGAKLQVGECPEKSPTIASGRKIPDAYDGIRVAYSKEWQLFDYSGDKTWGWTLGDRKTIFLEEMALKEGDLNGKRLLDAGCGNGTLTAALSTFGMEVVGVDLNDGLGLANSNKTRYAGASGKNVEYVQGNLFRPPLKHGSFDLMYCSGALHRTPNSKETFEKLIPLLAKGGRAYVWVSGRRNLIVRMFFDSRRQLKKVMSLESLLVMCRVMAPFYKAGTELLNALHIMEFSKRSVREITLDLYDIFAPEYENRHTEEEVLGWFKEHGFRNTGVSGRTKHGFGVYGDKN